MNLSDLSSWEWTSDGSDREAWQRDLLATWGKWKYLAPFFASHGLHIYEYVHGTLRFVRPPAHPKCNNSQSEQYPWARGYHEEEEDLDFNHIMAVRVWPARTDDGHEVMIRLSSGQGESEELKVIRRLNTPEARSDSRNYTIPILNTLTVEGLVFVVMPRWHPLSFHPWIRADSVSELFDIAEMHYEGLQFMHEKRVAHRDICPPNCVMNLLCREGRTRYGLRKRGEVHYAFIDFDASMAFPEDTDLDTVTVERLSERRPALSLHLEPGPCNPFKDDVLNLTDTLENFVRVAQPIVPEIGTFFDNILKGDYDRCPSAAEALKTLRELRANVSEAQLNAAPKGNVYNSRNGRITDVD
ncbi:hypothetical protein NMY22_g5109 [Coprinellus aureogranulatus]|nr:hypothetical protein NMY22_g5109 [Coprinellus aureogranulatus]